MSNKRDSNCLGTPGTPVTPGVPKKTQKCVIDEDRPIKGELLHKLTGKMALEKQVELILSEIKKLSDEQKSMRMSLETRIQNVETNLETKIDQQLRLQREYVDIELSKVTDSIDTMRQEMRQETKEYDPRGH
jgi:ABC-type phosphate transport system auxiliary subunit